MVTLALLIGIWSTQCIQTQIAGSQQGFVKESYAFKDNGEFEFKRSWFIDSSCEEANGADIETGALVLGKKTSTFFSGEAIEADFKSSEGTDLGLLSINNNKLKVARGLKGGSNRNSMLGIFEYSKN